MREMRRKFIPVNLPVSIIHCISSTNRPEGYRFVSPVSMCDPVANWCHFQTWALVDANSGLKCWVVLWVEVMYVCMYAWSGSIFVSTLRTATFTQSDNFLASWNDYFSWRILPVGWLLKPMFFLSQPAGIYASVRVSGKETLDSSL